MWILVRQSEELYPPFKSTGLHHQVIDSDIIQCCGEPAVIGRQVDPAICNAVQPNIEPRLIPCRDRIELHGIGPLLID